MYVFDNSPLSLLFKNFYRKRFPTLWTKFDALILSGSIVSTREVFREVQNSSIPELRDWASSHKEFFATPTSAEASFVSQIYRVKHFQSNIEQKKLLKGGVNADAFVVAKAAVERKTVVTLEVFKANGSKIPNICKHFGVDCRTLEEFMEIEGCFDATLRTYFERNVSARLNFSIYTVTSAGKCYHQALHRTGDILWLSSQLIWTK